MSLVQLWMVFFGIFFIVFFFVFLFFTNLTPEVKKIVFFVVVVVDFIKFSLFFSSLFLLQKEKTRNHEK